MEISTEVELSYETYQQRQWEQIGVPALNERAERITPGGRFRFAAGRWEPVSYRGHAVVTKLSSSPSNQPLQETLVHCQTELCLRLARPDLLFPLPPASFHQTIANTLSAEKHQNLVVARGLADVYPARVTSTFQDIPAPHRSESTVSMRMIGLAIFGHAIGVLGIFDQPEDFQRILRFRDGFYGHTEIGLLGIRRTRPFIGHITLAYLEGILDSDTRARLVDVLAAINVRLASRDNFFSLPFAELCAYEHLAEFKSLPQLPQARL